MTHKWLILVLLASMFHMALASNASAAEFKCYGLTVHVAARAAGYGSDYRAFLKDNTERWSCKYKEDSSRETVVFGDGSSFVSVDTKIVGSHCKVLSVDVGQDDGDNDGDTDLPECLE